MRDTKAWLLIGNPSNCSLEVRIIGRPSRSCDCPSTTYLQSYTR